MKMIKAILLSGLLMSGQAVFSQLYAGEVNINKADAVTLANELTGIGNIKAQAIVEYRKQNGPFTNVDDLQKVKGISGKTIDKNRQDIKL